MTPQTTKTIAVLLAASPILANTAPHPTAGTTPTLHTNVLLDLRWRPKPNENTTFLMVVRSKNPDDPFQAESVVEQTVTQVTESGYTVRSLNRSTLVRVGAEEVRDERPNLTVLRHTPDGRVQEITQAKDPDEAMRLAVVTRFVAPPAPVRPNETWQVTYPPRGEFPGARVTYRLAEARIPNQGSGTATVTFEFTLDARERPYRGAGTWTIDLANNQPFQLRANIDNWLDNGKASGILEITRRSPPPPNLRVAIQVTS